MKKFKGLNRKTLLTALCAFLCALLVVVSFGLLGSTKGKIADAQTSGTMSDTNTIKLDELTLSDYATRQDGKVFNGAVLDKLYDALTGNYSATATTHKTIADVKTSLGTAGRAYGQSGRQVTLDPYKDAKDLYDLNNNKNIVLDFGGDEWTVTFLTTDANGNLIATLWLTDLYKDENGNNVYTKMGWATTTSGAGNGGNQTSTYPGDMYSTSQARVETLNAGGVIATSATAAGSHAQSINNHWAKFTMTNTQLAGSDKANQSLTDYITKPNDVMYQHYENWQYQWATVSGNSSTYPLHNEALNTWNGTTGTATAVTSTGWYSNFNYTGNALYDDWGNDYLWLPSLSETGRISYSTIDGAIGLWRTTYSKTANTGQTTHSPANNPNTNWQTVADNTPYAWLRTGNAYAYNANYLSGSGSNNDAYTARSLAVRPALHLNLTSAAQAAALETPTDVTQYEDSTGALKDIVYDYSKTWTLTDFGEGAGWYDFANYISNTQYAYKNTGDATAFDTANPGVAPSGGLHNAGRYQVEFTTSSTLYGWNDPTNPTQTTNKATFIITIKQQEIEYEPKLYKGTSVVSSLNYGDTGGVVKANVASVSDTGTLAPDIEIKYAGANGTVYAASTTFPTAAGSYTATITDKNEKTSNYKIKLKTGASNPLSFTIGKKGVTLPTLSTATKTYNGTAQDFQIGNFDPAVLDISVITADGNTLTLNSTHYDDGNGKYTVTPSLSAAPYKFTATEAAEYKVEWVIKTAAQTNYTWDSTLNGQDKVITFEVEKKTLNLTLTPPSAANNSWSFPMGTTGDITATALTGVENNDPVTFNVSYYLKPATAGAAMPAPTTMQTDKAYTDIALDVSNFSSTGDYVVWVQLFDDSNGNDVNRNYKFAGQDTNTTPATENVCVVTAQVGSGSVSVSNIKWGYKEGAAGVLTQISSTTNIEYKKVSGTAQNYIVEIDPTTMPSYMQVDASYGTNGFTAGYSENDKTDANTYTAKARLKITNSDYKFESTGNNGYTYVSDTEAEITFSWTINQKELDLSTVDWVFSSNATGDGDTSATWTKFDSTVQGGNPEYTGQGFIYVKIDDAFMANLGLATGDYTISYGNTNQQILAQTSTTTNAYITLSNPNYKLPAVATGAPNVTFVWQISNKQIYISGWGNNASITGSDGAGGNKAYTFPRVTISNNDGTDYTQYIEYEYSYTIDGVPYTNRTEAQMIQDIFPLASATNLISGTVTVKLTAAGAQTYDLNGTALSWPFSCGASKTMVTVSLTGTHVSYDDGGDFAISATYYPGNMTSLSQMDFIATNGAKLEITLTDKDGQVKVFTADHAGDADVLEFVKNAGAYTVDFAITDTALEGAYALSDSQLIYNVARKEIVVPQVIKALTFNGSNVIFTDHLDNQYTANSSMIDVTGDAECRNVSSGNAYSVTLKLNDDNYCWVLPASTASATKGLVKITLADDTVETNVSIPATDPTRAVYSWNVAPMVVDTSKSWNNGKLTLPAGLQNLVNSGDVTVKYNYYNDAGELLGDSENGFEPQGGVSYRIEAVLEGTDADLGNIVFQSADGTTTSNTSDRVLYTAPKSGMAKFKDTLTTKYMGLPLWAWIVIGVAALILLIILICIIVAACKKKKKKEEEKAAKAEKEEAKAAAAAAAAAPMLAMSASMADEKAKLEAEKAKMEAELAKAKMEAEAEAARAKAQAEAEAAKAKAQAELDLQRAKTEAEIARMRAEAQQASQPAPAPVQQPVQQPQPQYQQQPQYMPQPQPQYIPMPMPQPQYMPQPQNNGGGSSSSVEHMLMEMKAQQAISEAKNEAQFRIMSAENKAAQEVAEAKAQARNNGNQMPYPPMMGMGMGMNPMMGMGMNPMMGMGYAQPQQQGNNSPVILTIGPNGEVKQLSTQPAAPVAQQPQVQPILINLGAQPQAQPAAQEQLPAPAQQSAPVAAEPAQPLSAQYPPGAVVTTTTTVDTTKTSSDVPEIRRRRNEENDLFDIDGFYDKYEGNN